MKKNIIALVSFFLFFQVSYAVENPSDANGKSRFGLNGGLVVVNETTSFALSAEYEYQPTSLYGLGAQGNYVFASQAFTQIAAPMAFVHPLLGDWYIAASPVFYLSSNETKIGARLITRAPLMIEILSLIPVLGVDFIQGGPNYIFGLGISI